MPRRFEHSLPQIDRTAQGHPERCIVGVRIGQAQRVALQGERDLDPGDRELPAGGAGHEAVDRQVARQPGGERRIVHRERSDRRQGGEPDAGRTVRNPATQAEHPALNALADAEHRQQRAGILGIEQHAPAARLRRELCGQPCRGADRKTRIRNARAVRLGMQDDHAEAAIRADQHLAKIENRCAKPSPCRRRARTAPTRRATWRRRGTEPGPAGDRAGRPQAAGRCPPPAARSGPRRCCVPSTRRSSASARAWPCSTSACASSDRPCASACSASIDTSWPSCSPTVPDACAASPAGLLQPGTMIPAGVRSSCRAIPRRPAAAADIVEIGQRLAGKTGARHRAPRVAARPR